MIQKSDISEEDVVGSFVPVVLLPVVVRPRTRSRLLRVFETRLFALENAVILQHLQPTLLPVLILDLFDDVIVLVIVIRPLNFLEASLSNAEARLLDDQVRILLLFFDHPRGDVIVNDVVTADRRNLPLFVDHLSLDL